MVWSDTAQYLRVLQRLQFRHATFGSDSIRLDNGNLGQSRNLRLSRAADNGEIAGSAGRPAMQAIRNLQQLTALACIRDYTHAITDRGLCFDIVDRTVNRQWQLDVSQHIMWLSGLARRIIRAGRIRGRHIS